MFESFIQWLNCKKNKWGTLPIPFVSFPPLSYFPSTTAKAPKKASGSGRALSGVRAKPWPQTHFGVAYFELENRTWRQRIFYARTKKKQELYRQEVPERRSGIQKSSGTWFRLNFNTAFTYLFIYLRLSEFHAFGFSSLP